MADMIFEQKYPDEVGERRFSVDKHESKFEALKELGRDAVLDMLNVVKVMDRVKPVSS
jgi:hypothetical protein